MSTLTDNYARALVQAAGPNARKVERALVGFAEAMRGSPDLSRALNSPAIDWLAQHKIIEALAPLFELPIEAVNLLKLVAKKHRMRYVLEMIAQVTQFVDDAEGIVQVDVTTSHTLSNAEQRQFEGTLKQGKNVRFSWHVRPELIGGATVRIGDSQWDGSVLRQLEDLRHTLTIKQG